MAVIVLAFAHSLADDVVAEAMYDLRGEVSCYNQLDRICRFLLSR